MFANVWVFLRVLLFLWLLQQIQGVRTFRSGKTWDDVQTMQSLFCVEQNPQNPRLSSYLSNCIPSIPAEDLEFEVLDNHGSENYAEHPHTQSSGVWRSLFVCFEECGFKKNMVFWFWLRTFCFERHGPGLLKGLNCVC